MILNLFPDLSSFVETITRKAFKKSHYDEKFPDNYLQCLSMYTAELCNKPLYFKLVDVLGDCECASIMDYDGTLTLCLLNEEDVNFDTYEYHACFELSQMIIVHYNKLFGSPKIANLSFCVAFQQRKKLVCKSTHKFYGQAWYKQFIGRISVKDPSLKIKEHIDSKEFDCAVFFALAAEMAQEFVLFRQVNARMLREKIEQSKQHPLAL